MRPKNRKIDPWGGSITGGAPTIRVRSLALRPNLWKRSSSKDYDFPTQNMGNVFVRGCLRHKKGKIRRKPFLPGPQTNSILIIRKVAWPETMGFCFVIFVTETHIKIHTFWWVLLKDSTLQSGLERTNGRAYYFLLFNFKWLYLDRLFLSFWHPYCCK